MIHLLKFGGVLLMEAHLLLRRTGSPEGHQSLLKAGAMFPAAGSGPSSPEDPAAASLPPSCPPVWPIGTPHVCRDEDSAQTELIQFKRK